MPRCPRCDYIIWWTTHAKYGGFCHWCWDKLGGNHTVASAVKKLWNDPLTHEFLIECPTDPREPLP